MYYPSIATAALFTAIIIVDAIKGNSDSIPNHAFLGLLSIGAMTFLSMKGADFVAWGILVLPMFIIALSFVLVYMESPIVTPATPARASYTPPASTASKPVLIGQTVQLPNIATGKTSPVLVTPSTSTCA